MAALAQARKRLSEGLRPRRLVAIVVFANSTGETGFKAQPVSWNASLASSQNGHSVGVCGPHRPNGSADDLLPFNAFELGIGTTADAQLSTPLSRPAPPIPLI
jgi:hypothetical protein